MPNTDVFALKRSGLNEFISATVGDESNGMPLSVMSVFARADTDPWQEAGRLAVLPRGQAIESLALSIAEMPSSVWSLAAATPIAERLVVLLPQKPKDSGHVSLAKSERTRPKDSGHVSPAKSQRTRSNVLVKMGLEAVVVAVLIAHTCGLF